MWRYVEREGKKPGKQPYSPRTGTLAKTSDSSTWGTYDDAVRAMRSGGYEGLGFVVTDHGPFSGIDLDDCREPKTGGIEPWAQKIIDAIDSYTEVSPSGRGIRIWLNGKVPRGARKRKGAIEIYSREQYLTVTGQHLEGTPLTVEHRQDQLSALHADVFGASKAKRDSAPREERDSRPRLGRADKALIERAKRAKDGTQFTLLWEGRWKEAGYPSASEADQALCLRLAYWAKHDLDGVDQLFRASGLMRDKWDELHGAQTYGEATIEKAIEKSLERTDASDPEDRLKLVLKAVTAADVGAMTQKAVPWLVEPWVAQGGMTELTGSVKWAGKTTLVSFMVRQMLDGQQFLGHPTMKGPAVWLTEQNEITFRQVLERAGLMDRRDLYVVFWHRTLGYPWEDVAHAAVELANRVGAKLLIVDTLGQFSGLEDENSSAQAMAALKPLQLATANRLAVVVVRQDRKSGGRVGESGRGSTAFAGGVDVLVSLERPEADPASTVRKLTAIGRFPDIAPELFIRLTPSGYVALGEARDYALQHAKERLRARLPRAEAEAMTLDAFLGQEPEVTRSAANRGLEELVAEGSVRQIGRGVRGDPRRFILLT